MANSVDPDQMLHYAAPDLDPHRLLRSPCPYILANSADSMKIFFLFSFKTQETIDIRFQNLFLGKNKKNILKCFLQIFLFSMLSIKLSSEGHH